MPEPSPEPPRTARRIATPEGRPRVLLVGPYERDNLGDLLFLLVTERYLGEAETVAAAPFAADMRALLDREVPAYGPLLERERFDAIWSVGGQLGGVDLRRAFRMSAPHDEYRAFLRASRRGSSVELLRRAAGGALPAWPYVPAPVAHPLNAGAITVVNSAGLGSLKRLEERPRAERLALLRGQTFVAVRDRASSELLSAAGVEHRLAPDAVHAISVLHPVVRAAGSDVAVFQASGSTLRALGIGEVAAALAASARLRGLRLRLLPAGTATGHDSLADYEQLARRLHRSAPWLDARIVRTRRPLELVDEIARARVVIGSSLHVRILACAYGVARLTLPRRKVADYARDWDSRMPSDVSLGALDAAIGEAMALADDPAAAAASAELSRRAHEDLTRLADEVVRRARTETEADRARRAEGRRQQQIALMTDQLTAQEAELQRLRGETERLARSRWTERLADRLRRAA